MHIHRTTRLEAYSDAVIAIIMTIMVLELRPPHGGDMAALMEVAPIFLSYVLSFLYVAIYWNNHHHMLHATEGVTAGIMWANMHLLFWLSLIPFATAWMGESHGEHLPVAAYGLVLFMSAIAYWILQALIIQDQGKNSPLRKAVGRDLKGKISCGLYLLAILTAFMLPLAAQAIFVLVALLWVIPDRRVTAIVGHVHSEE